MHPELFTLPGGLSIKTYGFCLMVGFLTAVWLAMRRAQRVKANPDTVLDISFFALIFGVGGARMFYVAHYWAEFAGAENTLLAVIDIRRGGLEFLGGFLAATAAILAYLTWKKQSIRLYLDIMAPSAMWGLALGRLGCFFNGCCFGSLCLVPGTQQAAVPWAVQFPYHSPAHIKQWENRRTTIPAELIVTPEGALQSGLVPNASLSMSVERREGPLLAYRELREEYLKAKAESPEGKVAAELTAKFATAKEAAQKHERTLAALRSAQRYPSRVEPTRRTSVSELEDLAGVHRSLPVHPTQLYSFVHAIILSGFLSALFYVRKRHGVVIAALFVLYPIARVVLEQIRTDNPHQAAGLTISQLVSLGMFVAGVAYMVYLYKYLPQRSPYADAAAVPKDSK